MIEDEKNEKNFRQAGLTEGEYKILVERLGREPNYLELRMIGVMWSEHCSYKSTRNLLKMLPTEGDAVVKGAGENAGVVDIGGGLGLAFKVESHNHPSAVAPYQGAATGVGGIIRDILAMGARPIASLDGLCFGHSKKAAQLAEGIVEGIGGYGNAVGVPTVGGLTIYDECYDENPLVNAFCAGIVAIENLASSQTATPELDVVLLGSLTGRDGIAGAAFASKELEEEARNARPQIQIGDPFEEKLLIEACLELQEKGLIVGMQDMGAAGILSSSSEIAYKSEVGMDIYCDKIPLREIDMQPWEIFLSESQERMLLVVEPNKTEAVKKFSSRYGLSCEVIGKTNATCSYRVLGAGGEILCDLPIAFLGGESPLANLKMEEPSEEATRRQILALDEHPDIDDVGEALKELFSDINLSDKSHIYEQYDSMVQINTVSGPPNPVAVLRVKGQDTLLMFAMELHPWFCALSPYDGAAELTCAALRQLYIGGATPLGLTNCLNFPSPEVPAQYWALAECVRGIADACRELDCPVVSGNVSLYNETPSTKIMPSPLVVAVGRMDGASGKNKKDKNNKQKTLLFMVGSPAAALGGSLYGVKKFGLKGRPVPFNAALERDFRVRALKTAHENLSVSARAIGRGGLAVAIAKEAIKHGAGFSVNCPLPLRKDLLFFAEGTPRALYCVSEDAKEAFLKTWRGYPLMHLGFAHDEQFIKFQDEREVYIEELKKIRSASIGGEC